MPINEALLAAEINDELNKEMGGGGKNVAKYRLKMSKAIAKAVVKHIRVNLKDTWGNSHF